MLVVDDDPFQRRVLRAWLSEAGWDVAEAGDVGEALAAIAGVSVAFVDLRLDEADGYEVARRLGSLSLESPPALVAVSATMSESERRRCRDAGFVHTMAKPLQREAVVDAVRRLAGGAGGRAVGAGGARPQGEAMDGVPESLRGVPALAALWRMEQTSPEPELVPAVEGLRQAGRLLAACGDGEARADTVTAAAHGLAGVAGMLGCTRVEVTSKALASKVRETATVDGETRLLISVIVNEVEAAVESLLRKIEAAR